MYKGNTSYEGRSGLVSWGTVRAGTIVDHGGVVFCGGSFCPTSKQTSL